MKVKREVTIGDKLANKHGNKGVVCHIIPEAKTPYVEEDDRPIDAFLNPLGLFSRTNWGQYKEMLISAILYKYNQDFVALYEKVGAEKAIRFFTLKAARLTKANDYAKLLESRLRSLDDKTMKIIIKNIKAGTQLIPIHIPPFRAAKYQDLIKLAEDAKILELKTIHCPELGRKIKAFVGYIYFYRLEHMASDKMNARSTGVYRYKTRQPVRGKKEIGGQNIDEGQTWSALAHDVPSLMEELKTVQSDEFEYKDKVTREIMEGKEASLPKITRKTAIYQMYQALMAGLHIQV